MHVLRSATDGKGKAAGMGYYPHHFVMLVMSLVDEGGITTKPDDTLRLEIYHRLNL